MLVLKIPKNGHVLIYDKTDGLAPPIRLMVTPQGSLGIEADMRYGIVRSNATDRTPKEEGGKDARSISA